MAKRIKRVVGIAFIKNGKLLTCQSVRSSKSNSFTLIGGGIKKFETIYRGAIRECKEEINKNFVIEKKDLELITIFIEPAESDPRILVKMHLFLSKKEVDVKLMPSKEILEFRWHKLGNREDHLSSSIREYFIPYAKKKKIMY